MDKVNGSNAQFLCITGDFIDAPGIGEEQLSALSSCPVPIYFCIGNHERYEDLNEILQRLQRLGVMVLRTATATQGEVQLVGIDDSDNPSQVKREIARLDIDPQRFVLLLYHRPRGLAAAAAAGVDLMISGHTHRANRAVQSRGKARVRANRRTVHPWPDTIVRFTRHRHMGPGNAPG